jgi:arylsulfatase A-like enzyme
MTATSERPNVLLITTDQQRYDALGLANPDSPLRTPTLDDLATRGVWFRRAYTTSPVCIPSRRSLLSGLHPQTHGLRTYRDGLDWDAPISLPGLLSDAGYQTQLIGKLHLHPQRKRYGYDHMIRAERSNDRWGTPLQPTNDWVDWMKAQGYEHPTDIGINGNGRNARPWGKPEHTHLTSWLADQAVDFVTRTRDPSCPFFLHLSFIAPHPPLTPPQAYWDRYFRRHDERPVIGDWAPQGEPARGRPDDAATGPFPLQEIQDAMAGYWASIHHIDDRIRYVLTRLFEYGSPRAKEPTLILFTTDHGELLGEHHLWRKTLPYEGSSHIPFLISGRNIPDLKPGISDDLVCLEDVVATVLDRCGVDLPAPLGTNRLDGQSLVSHIRGEGAPVRDRLHGECGGYHFIVKDSWKYLWFQGTGEEQLFDLAEDPHECVDRSAETDRLEPFRGWLDEYLADRDDVDFAAIGTSPCVNQPPRAIWG